MRQLSLFALCLTVLAAAPTSAWAGSADDADLILVDGGLAQLRFVGLLQVEMAPYVGDDAFLLNGDPAESPGFRLRRARVGFAGSAWGDTDYELSLQATPDGIDLLDAWVAWRGLTSLTVYGGARKVPFSRFALNSAMASALIDRPLGVRAMAPFRQVGLTLEGDVGDGILQWAAGVYNGFVRSTTFYQGYGTVTALQGNRFTNLAYVARVDLSPFGPIGQGLADLDQGDFRGALGGAVYYDDGKTVQTFGWEVDVLLKVSGLHFAAELIMDSSEPATQPTTGDIIPTTIGRMSAVAELGYVLLPEQLGVTLRGELIDSDTDVDNAGDEIAVTGGVQYYFHRQHAKAALEFTHREERHGVALDNDSLLLQLQFAL
ncbi:MAG: hypothetical protein EP329_07915 [Deltaproteobacteria bacterium]|nr:MAG: hypothetical protein EP329_07915 [Deltaproteobacteria bacterium]